MKIKYVYSYITFTCIVCISACTVLRACEHAPQMKEEIMNNFKYD